MLPSQNASHSSIIATIPSGDNASESRVVEPTSYPTAAASGIVSRGLGPQLMLAFPPGTKYVFPLAIGMSPDSCGLVFRHVPNSVKLLVEFKMHVLLRNVSANALPHDACPNERTQNGK